MVIQLLTPHLEERGKGSPSKCERSKQREGLSHQCERSHINFLNWVPSPYTNYNNFASFTIIFAIFIRIPVLLKISILKNLYFLKQPPRVFHRKRCCLKPAILLKKTLRHRCFPVNFAKFLRPSFLQNTSGWLLLDISFVSKITNQLHLLQTINLTLFKCQSHKMIKVS